MGIENITQNNRNQREYFCQSAFIIGVTDRLVGS